MGADKRNSLLYPRYPQKSAVWFFFLHFCASDSQSTLSMAAAMYSGGIVGGVKFSWGVKQRTGIFPYFSGGGGIGFLGGAGGCLAGYWLMSDAGDGDRWRSTTSMVTSV